MAFTLAGNDLQSADVQLLAYGIWTAEVSLADAKPLTVGSAVQLVLSDLTLSGTIRSGGEFVGESRYFIVGGADGWPKTVKRRAYRTDSGVRLSQVAQDLAGEVEETVVVLQDRVLGYAWQRLGGPASAALQDMAGSSWWVGPDGKTYVGRRPASTIPTSTQFVVESYDPRFKRAVLSSPEDKIAVFQPGASFTAETITGAFTIKETYITVRVGSVSLRVLG
jgi:hypothetical protein